MALFHSKLISTRLLLVTLTLPVSAQAAASALFPSKLLVESGLNREQASSLTALHIFGELLQGSDPQAVAQASETFDTICNGNHPEYPLLEGIFDAFALADRDGLEAVPQEKKRAPRYFDTRQTKANAFRSLITWLAAKLDLPLVRDHASSSGQPAGSIDPRVREKIAVLAALVLDSHPDGLRHQESIEEQEQDEVAAQPAAAAAPEAPASSRLGTAGSLLAGAYQTAWGFGSKLIPRHLWRHQPHGAPQGQSTKSRVAGEALGHSPQEWTKGACVPQNDDLIGQDYLGLKQSAEEAIRAYWHKNFALGLTAASSAQDDDDDTATDDRPKIYQPPMAQPTRNQRLAAMGRAITKRVSVLLSKPALTIREPYRQHTEKKKQGTDA